MKGNSTNDKFLKYQAQTTTHPFGMEVDYAKGSYVYDQSGKAYLDFVAGVSACALGHCHPKVVSAIKQQAERYLHVMVYGEYAQTPAVKYAELLAQRIRIPQAKTYLVNSGTEAIEGALKLARRYTGRQEIIAAKKAYHGNTMGALSLMGVEKRKKPFEPLIPEVSFVHFNEEADLLKITKQTACVILETIQGGAGIILPEKGYLQKVKNRCEQTGSLLILDEIQPGFGRTGKLFGYEHEAVIPDILVIGKAMAGGLPVGGFVSRAEVMDCLRENPEMAHITTFGGNPVIAAAALATLQEILQTDLMPQTLEKEKRFRSLLKHELIKEIRGKGLMIGLIMASSEVANQLILKAKHRGLLLFWLLIEKRAVRITPPLTISMDEIKKGCTEIIAILDEINRERC